MRAEILYRDYFLFGDEANASFLQRCLPDWEFIFTEIKDKPYFAEHDVDFIYMGAMSERNQERVITALAPYTQRLAQLIDDGVYMLFTANACDILGSYIVDEGVKTPCLGLFDFHVVRKMMQRFNDATLAEVDGVRLVGFKSQFGIPYTDTCHEFFAKVIKGTGLNPDCPWEGFRRNNLIATYLIGPFLVINPIFTKKLLSEIAKREVNIPFEKEALECYNARLLEFKD